MAGETGGAVDGVVAVAGIGRRLRDRPFMARLRRRLAALDTEWRAPRLTKDQCLDQTPLDR